MRLSDDHKRLAPAARIGEYWYTLGMQLVLALGAVAVIFLVVGLVVVAIKWLTIIALIVGVLAIAQFYRERRN